MLCKSIERGNLVVGESGMEKETMMQSYMEQHLMSIPELEVGQIVTGTVAVSYTHLTLPTTKVV